MIGSLKKRVTWSENNLHVLANIVIEDDVEESAVKMISPFDYKIIYLKYHPTKFSFTVYTSLSKLTQVYICKN